MPQPIFSAAQKATYEATLNQTWRDRLKAGYSKPAVEPDTAPSLPLKFPKRNKEQSGNRKKSNSPVAVVRTLRFVQMGCDAMVAILDQSLRHKRPDAYVRLSLLLCANIVTCNRVREFSIGDICELSGLSRSTVSTTLTALEGDGVIKRKRHSRGLLIYINPSVAWLGTQNERTLAVDLWHNTSPPLKDFDELALQAS